MANSKIMAVISGDFSLSNQEINTRHSEFFDKVMKEMPNGIVIVETTGEIKQANISACRLFGLSQESFVGKNIITILGDSTS